MSPNSKFPTLFEKSRSGRRSVRLPHCDSPDVQIPGNFLRETPPALPEIAEIDLVRHYTELSRRSFGVDNGFYPLGSCTMKYNPKFAEDVASLPGFTGIHPLQPAHTAEGCLEVEAALKSALCEITGMDDYTLQPAAGAQGEVTGLLMIRAYHQTHGEDSRTIVLVPDSAHGTNPASAAVAGYSIVTVSSNKNGQVDIEALKRAVGLDTAALMLTNPNTVGLFEEQIEEIAAIVHEAGALLYYDGANLNAIMGIARPGDMGFDICHVNLHKTFATPHGMGGPGSGPIGCKARLSPYLPVSKPEDYSFGDDEITVPSTSSIGRVKAFHGHFLVSLRALAYIMVLGSEGLKAASEAAVLHANVLKSRLEKLFGKLYEGHCMHEFVISLEALKKETGVSALDVAKGLLDMGIHPPTMYFPLIVPEALMIEPTETESPETLLAFSEAMASLYNKAHKTPNELKEAPLNCHVRRLDEVRAARTPKLRA